MKSSYVVDFVLAFQEDIFFVNDAALIHLWLVDVVLFFFACCAFVIYDCSDDTSLCSPSSLLLRTESPLLHLLLLGDLTCYVADGLFFLVVLRFYISPGTDIVLCPAVRCRWDLGCLFLHLINENDTCSCCMLILILDRNQSWTVHLEECYTGVHNSPVK